MKIRYIAVSLCLFPLVPSCEKNGAASDDKPDSKEVAALKAADTPLLAVRIGDSWRYKVRVEVPAGVTSETAAAFDIEQERTRVFKGKVFVAKGLPETEAFDVATKGAGQPVERELVEIHADRILMRGSTRPDVLGSEPIWLDPPVLFIKAGVRAGDSLAGVSMQDGARTRGLHVVAREKVSVPAGEYEAVRLLMSGNDGKFDFRRTTWFVPKVGIVKSENARYTGDNLIFRETAELVETTMGGADN